MTVKEFRDKVREAGKLVIGERLTCTMKENEEIDMYINGTLVAWVNAGQKGNENIENSFSVFNHLLLHHIVDIAQFAQYAGIEVGGIKPIVVEKTITRDDFTLLSEIDTLRGKVEVYKSLVEGRTVSLGVN